MIGRRSRRRRGDDDRQGRGAHLPRCAPFPLTDDVPGLATGADDIEALVAKLKALIPELLDANGVAGEQD